VSSDQEREAQEARQEEFMGALEELEQCLEMPFVPGELRNWLSQTEAALEQLTPELQVQTEHVHREEFAAIAEEDPELLRHVEEMRDEDQVILERRNQIADRLSEFQAFVERSNSDEDENSAETALKDDLEQFVAEALEWVIRIRKQEVAVRTWLVEAYTRDRGTVD